MLRSSLLRSSFPRSRTGAVPRLATRLASTTHAPTTSSGGATDIYGPPQDNALPRLSPGEEIDPQLHGYPQLPYTSLQQRPAFGWWDQQERKNFGEVVHEEEDALGMWGPDVFKISGGTAVISLIAAFSAVAGFAYFLTATRPLRPVAAREYPYGGLEEALGGHSKGKAEDESSEE